MEKLGVTAKDLLDAEDLSEEVLGKKKLLIQQNHSQHRRKKH